MTTQRKASLPSAALGVLVLFSCQNAYPYSVLTHEAIVDSTWDSAIQPLLLKRFPTATADDLASAHAYAYGGCIIQDLGYYPFGSKFYSDLTHYVRSGDFISNMIRESQDLDEYAFALGALAHFAADNNGHRMATNVSVPLLYPKLRLKFGNSITYADDPFSHSKTEFGFDVFQAAKSRYASDAYKRFIGFQVAKPMLQRAFLDTYGMKIEHVFLNIDLAIGSYRRAVGTVLPALTKVAWQNQASGDQEGCSRHNPEKISLQSVSLQLRKELGRHLSATGDPVENAGGLLPHRAQSRPIQGAGV
jgi:Zinc dependent phospholipase C